MKTTTPLEPLTPDIGVPLGASSAPFGASQVRDGFVVGSTTDRPGSMSMTGSISGTGSSRSDSPDRHRHECEGVCAKRALQARVFDLLIAMIALEHNANEIWSHDKGFVTLPGVTLVDPID